MKNLRVAVFEKSSLTAYTMGLDFCSSFERSGAELVLSIPFKKYLDKFGLIVGLRKIKYILKNNNINTIFYALDNCFDFPPDFFDALKPDVCSCIYIGDDEHYFERSAIYYAQCFDLVLTCSPLSIYRYKIYGLNCMFLPSHYNLLDFEKLKKIECEDVIFTGSISGKVGREEYINSLYNSEIYFGSYGASSKNGIVKRDKMLSLFKSAKISLNFTGVCKKTSLDYDMSIHRHIKAVKGRCQEIALSGGFVLTEYAPGIENMFDIGNEIDIFDSIDEMHKKINFYLENSALRKKMAFNANIKAKELYSDLKVWDDVGNHIKNLLDSDRKPKPIFFDPIFKRAYSSFYLSRLIGHLVRFRLKNFIYDLSDLSHICVPNFKLFLKFSKKEIYIPLIRKIKRFF